MPPQIPTSRAYWNLRAEQVLDRVFNDDDNILKTMQVQVNPQSKQQEATSTADELEIAALPNASSTQLDQITVPLPTAEVTTTSIAGQASAVTPQPLLVGVVHAGNGDGSAIFQLGDLSLSTVPGEAIGNSGWTLQSVSANGAVIERSGATESLSVGGAF